MAKLIYLFPILLSVGGCNHMPPTNNPKNFPSSLQPGASPLNSKKKKQNPIIEIDCELQAAKH